MNSARKELYNNNRRERQSKSRQALLINDYVYTKYFHIYREAAEYYNQLNAIYPTKRDLRRCAEFKNWKRVTSGQTLETKSTDRRVQQHNLRYHVVFHPPISLDQSASPESSDIDTALPESPELPDQQRLELTAADSTELPEQQLTVPKRAESSANPVGNKIMQLNIPLMKPTVVTETLQVVTQETLGNSLQVAAEEIIQDDTTLHSTLEEGLPQHIIDNIINELRADPELKRVMTEIDEFEQLGMDLDIPENDPFQEEIENLLHW